MRTYREFIFSLFDIHWVDSGLNWWVSIAEVQVTDWNGSLLHVEYSEGRWFLDALYLKRLVLKILEDK